jgi:bacterioferritin
MAQIPRSKLHRVNTTLTSPEASTSGRPMARPSLDRSDLRRRLQENLQQGALTPNYQGDVAQAIQLLNEALATELVCVLRYKNHYYAAQGMMYEPIAEEFEAHAKEEMEHADQIAERIHQLGGSPEMNPTQLIERSHSEYKTSENLVELIEQDLIAERIAIESYREMVRFFGVNDPTSRRVMEKVLAKEEEHATDLVHFLSGIDPTHPFGK